MTTLSRDLIGVKQTASLLHCSRSKVKNGYGPEPVMRFGVKGERLFRRSEVEAFKMARETRSVSNDRI